MNRQSFDFSVPIDVEEYGLDSEKILGSALRQKIFEFWKKKKKATWELGIDVYSPFTKTHQAFLLSRAKERALIGGNSSSKSWTGAAFVTALALGKHPTIDIKVPNSGWLACEDFSLVKDGPVKAITTLGKNYIKEINAHDKIIKWVNGSETGIKSYESGWKKFQSAEKDYVWLDEEPPEDIYKECQMRTMRSSGYILTTMTPLEGMTWMYDYLFDESDAIETYCASLYDNYTLDEKDIARTIRKYSEEELQARVYGKFTQMAGLFYKGFNRGVHVIEPFELNKDDFVVFRGIDPHIATPTAVIFLAIHRNGQHFIVNEMFEGGTIPEISRNIKAVSSNYRLGYTVMDAAAKTDIKIYGCDIWSDFAKQGVNSILSPKGPGSIGKGVSDIAERLKVNEITGKPGLLIFKNCYGIIKAMQTLTRETYRDESKKGKKDKIAESKYHHHAALRYVYQMQPKFFEPISNDDLDKAGYIPMDEVTGA